MNTSRTLRSGRVCPRRRAMTLIEIIIGMAVVVIAILGIMSALVAASRMDETTAEQVRALN
ncbi:MAG TPA: hypothetical protein VFC86_00490, partial [Planctomycetota bacterium]|nr:hypothetical protein [Planctomycetota bacterium]